MIRTPIDLWSVLFYSLLDVSVIRSKSLFVLSDYGMPLAGRTAFEAHFVVVVSVSGLAVSIRRSGSIEWPVRCLDDAACLTSLRSWIEWLPCAYFYGLSYLTLRYTPWECMRSVS